MLFPEAKLINPTLLDEYQGCFAVTPRKSADYTFTNLWGWSEHYGLHMAFAHDLCWIEQTRVRPGVWAPVGDWSRVDWASLPQIRAGITLERVPVELAALLKEQLGDKVREEPQREQWEYLYSRQELAELKGNKFHKKKNHVNAFQKTYGEDYRVLDKDSADEVLQLQSEWCRWRDCEKSPSLQAENDVIFRVVGNWGRLPGLTGGALYVENVMVAFAVGEALDESTLVVHFEKVQPDYKGVYQAINNAFIRHAGEGFATVNREQDLGEEGLRQAKETYNPTGFLEKSRIVIQPF